MKANLDENKLLKPEEAAEFLGIPKKSLKTMRQRGEGPCVVQVTERVFRYRYGALVKYINRNEIKNST